MTMTKWIVGGAFIAAAMGAAAYLHGAKAADLGGNCCADLEERLSEIEATVARKGNRKVSLAISGQISKSILWSDGLGLASDNKLRVIDNGNSGSRVRLTGEAKINPTTKAGFVFEYGFDETRGMGLGPVAGPLVHWLDGDASMRKSAVYVETAVGRVTVGKFDMATEHIVEIDVSESGLASRMLSIEPVWSYLGISGLPLIGGNLLNPLPFHDLRAEIVRYDSPKIGGFEAAFSWGGGQTLTGEDMWDAALRWSGEGAGFRVAAGAGYRVEKFSSSLLGITAPEQKTVSGSASAMHLATGLFLTVAAADQKDNPVFGDIQSWHAKAGWQKNVFGPGATTVFGEYAEHSLSTLKVDSSFVGAGVTQAIDAAAMEIYISGRQYQSDIFSGDATVIHGGARIRF